MKYFNLGKFREKVMAKSAWELLEISWFLWIAYGFHAHNIL